MDSKQAKTAKTFDSYKETYTDAVDSSVAFTGLSTDFFTRVKADYLVDECRGHFGGAETLSALDVGCGVGNYHSLLSGQFKKLSGVDVSGECVDAARRRNKDVEYQVYDGAELPYASGTFDLVFSICVMHHVPPENWPLFAKEIHRVLRPGGLALIFEHNPRNPFTMRVVNRCAFDVDAVLLRSEETERLLREAGFSNLSTQFILAIPAATRLLRRVDSMFARLPIGGQYYVSAVA